MKITTTDTAPSVPGIYAGISNADYHAGPGISKSGLDVLAVAPAKYYDTYISPTRVRRDETAAMRFGTLVHTAILEPHEINRWLVMDKVDRRYKEGKAAYAAALEEAEASGRLLVDRDEYDTIMAMSTSFYGARVSEHFDTGVPELSVYWIDEDSGVFCRCRPDWLGSDAIVDLKTTDDASPDGFRRSAMKWRYHVQAAFYLDGLSANGIELPYFIFAAVEKHRPHLVMGHGAGHNFIESGRREYKRLLKLYADCASSQQWPSYGDYAELELPRWANDSLADFDIDAIASSTESL